MRIALFDYRVTPTNPIGGCHLRVLRGLCAEHQFTVFAPRFDNPCPERITWVRVPVPLRPLALLYVAFHLVAPIVYAAYRLRHGLAFDVVQMVESNLSFGDVDYSQFCHGAYLRRHWTTARARGIRGVLRWLDHRLHATLEPLVYGRARHIVVASNGLARELRDYYPGTADRISVIPNPVDLGRMRRPPDFDPTTIRTRLGVPPDHTLLTFVALGQFERKGLPLLLDAMRLLDNASLSLVVIGGEDDLVTAWRTRVAQLGLANRVHFEGMRHDVRPYLWAADAFILPSAYEVFPLAALEAAGAGLPVIATPLNGVEEFLRDDENGLLIERTPHGICEGLRRFLALPREHQRRLGERAQRDVQVYGTEQFVSDWRAFYAAVCARRVSARP